MSDELTLESLQLSKPLEKMTAKELRELTIEKIPQITGASGMGKDELVSTIKAVLGITEDRQATAYKEEIWSLKRRIKDLRAQKMESDGLSQKDKDKLRKQIKQLKRRTRRLAAG
jgi:polyhydroxyalkanoate synthesis regulator phasin